MRTRPMLLPLLALTLAAPACAQSGLSGEGAAPPPDRARAQPGADMPRAELFDYYEQLAQRVGELVESDLARAFVAEADEMPTVEPFTVYIYPSPMPEGVTRAQYMRLPAEAREPLRELEVNSAKYYQTIFGPPLTYARPLDLVATEGGWETLEGKSVFDFGYGQMGQVRMMAQCGADVVGTDVSSLLAALYERESSVPEVTGSTGKTGSINLHLARWPAGQRAIDLVGEGYDLFLARDVLRTGRMDPQAELERHHRVELGVYPDTFLSELNRVLNDDGLVMIYNTGRRDPLQWGDRSLGADIRSPFSPEQWEQAGFELIALDETDDEAMRDLAYALDMDEGQDAIDPERHVFARYTLARKVRDLGGGENAKDEAEKEEEDVPMTPWGTPIKTDG